MKKAMVGRAYGEPYGNNSNHFSVNNKPLGEQLLAWRDRVAHILDVLPSIEQIAKPFQASIDRYQIDDRLFTDCSSDALLLDRSIGRISTDNLRGYLFHVFVQGGIDFVNGQSSQISQSIAPGSIAVIDLNQPFRVLRSKCRVLSLFVPRAAVEAIFPNASTLHGRVLENTMPLTQVVNEQVIALAGALPAMPLNQAAIAFDVCIELILAAFGKQTNLQGNARAAVRAAMLDKARRHIADNLHQASLSPESLMAALQLPRPTIYRLFEHEGGLGAYIRNCRLREAADELVNFPTVSIQEIAYGLGFKSASDFTRAFRRAYALSPQEMRSNALERMRILSPA